MAETRSTIKVLLILYFVSDPESESESESIRSPESKSEQPHHDSASPLHMHLFKKVILASIYSKEMLTVLAMYLIS